MGDSNSTKARLNGILESFHAFDSDMKTGTRVRRENDEHRIAQLTAELTRLEKTLNQEIKRRVEMNKSVQVVSKPTSRTAVVFVLLLCSRERACRETLRCSLFWFVETLLLPGCVQWASCTKQ